MVKLVLALVLVAHGIGHSMGILRVLNLATVNPAWQGDSWLLSGVAGTAVTNAVGLILWSASIVGFAALGGVVLGWLPADWWAPVAIASSAVSIAGIVLFPIAFPTVSTLGALAIDVAVLAAVLWFHWTPGDLPA
jgi:hypothetical protein